MAIQALSREDVAAASASDLPEDPATRRKRGTLARMIDTRPGRGLIQIATVAVFFAAWEIAVDAGWLTEFLVGAPSGIWRVFIKSLWTAASHTTRG